MISDSRNFCCIYNLEIKRDDLNLDYKATLSIVLMSCVTVRAGTFPVMKAFFKRGLNVSHKRLEMTAGKNISG